MTTLALVDDHRVILDGLRAWLAHSEDLEVRIAVTTWHSLLAHPGFPTDVVVLDLALGDSIPVRAKIPLLRAAGCGVLVVSATADPDQIRAALDSGADGFVPKSTPASQIAAAAREVAAGGSFVPDDVRAMLEREGSLSRPGLSAQEHRALVLYSSNLPLKSVARRMGVSEQTAKSYLDRVRDKYAAVGIEARTKLALRQQAINDGWLVE